MQPVAAKRDHQRDATTPRDVRWDRDPRCLPVGATFVTGTPRPPRPGPAHPLLVELEELLGDLRGAHGQAQAVDVELGDDVLQRVLQREAPHRAVLGGGGGGVLQDGAAQRDELGGARMGLDELGGVSRGGEGHGVGMDARWGQEDEKDGMETDPR